MSTKTDNARQASYWLSAVDNNPTYKKYVDKSIKHTIHKVGELLTKDEINYVKEVVKNMEDIDQKPKILISIAPTYDEILDCYNRVVQHLTVLNFASYFNCGGGFLKGSIAQEESLCHVSGLYSILYGSEVYSKRNEKNNIPPEYVDEVIYSPNVPFTVNEGYITSQIYLVDVISIAAPNCNRVPIARYNQYIKVLRKRIESILVEPYLNGTTTLILGAWGCGVFKNDPKLIAQLFDEAIQKYGRLYNEIIFAIPNEAIYDTFNEIIVKG